MGSVMFSLNGMAIRALNGPSDGVVAERPEAERHLRGLENGAPHAVDARCFRAIETREPIHRKSRIVHVPRKSLMEP